MYSIISRNYIDGEMTVLHSCDCAREILSHLEGYAYDFVEQKEGHKISTIYPESASGKYGKIPFGYSICRANEKFLKLTVLQKIEVPGLLYLYNTWKVSKVISYEILRNDPNEPSPMDRDELDEKKLEDKTIKWQNIHSEIKIKKSKAEAF